MSGRVVSDIQTRAEGENLYIRYNTDAYADANQQTLNGGRQSANTGGRQSANTLADANQQILNILIIKLSNYVIVWSQNCKYKIYMSTETPLKVSIRTSE